MGRRTRRDTASLRDNTHSEGHAVTQAGVSAPDEQEGNSVTFERDVERGMNMNSVKDYERRDGFREADVESANRAHFVIMGAVHNAAIGGDRQTSLAFQILAEGGVEGLSGGRADSV